MGGDAAALRSVAGTEGDGDRDKLVHPLCHGKVSARMRASILADNPTGTKMGIISDMWLGLLMRKVPSASAFAPTASGDPDRGCCRVIQDTRSP